MIALIHFEQSLQEVFPEQCLKVAPDPEFLSNLYEFDMSKCPHERWVASISHVAQTFFFDSVNLSSKVPDLLVWMQNQVCQIIVVLFTFFDTSIETS